jgi:hypothetical protein
MLAHANAQASGKEPEWIADLYLEALATADPALLKEAQAMTPELGGPAIVIDLTPKPVNAAGPEQLVVPASEGAPLTAQPVPAGTVLSDSASTPSAPPPPPLGFGASGAPQ